MIKFQGDTRYSQDDASTHDRTTIDAVACLNLSEVTAEQLRDVDVLGIDEGQFFPDLVQFADAQANSGKIVIVSALSGTYERKGFGGVLNLIPLSEKVDMLNAVCKFCLKDAAFSARLGPETAVQVIGGADKYASACRNCFKLQSYHSPARVPLKKRAATGSQGTQPKRLAFTVEKVNNNGQVEEAESPSPFQQPKSLPVKHSLETPVTKPVVDPMALVNLVTPEVKSS